MSSRRLGVIRTLVSPRLILGVALVWAVASIPLWAANAQQDVHGAALGKSCKTGTCLEPTDCTIEVSHNDDFGDTIRILSVRDIVHAGSGDVTIDPLEITSVTGNTNCVVSNPAALPCEICGELSNNCGLTDQDPGWDTEGEVQFRSNQYVIQQTDPAPLNDSAEITLRDLCDGDFDPGCVQFPDPFLFPGSTLWDPNTCECPFVSVVKSCGPCDPNSDPPNQSEVTITVRNDGNGEATNCLVVDTVDGEASPCIDELITTLAPGEVRAFSCDTLPHTEDVTNSVSVVCDSVDANGCPGEVQASDSDSAVCPCRETVVNNFKCYNVKTAPRTPRFQRRPVTLTDQFGGAQAQVLRPFEFCNPVDKNGEGIEDPNAHLMCYKLLSRDRRARLSLIDTDQFFPDGELLAVGAPGIELCQPALKNCDPAVQNCDALLEALEARLNHFQCYRARVHGADPRNPATVATVDLEDQFGATLDVDVLQAKLHCNPVMLKGEVSVLVDPSKHLKCYPINADDPRLGIEITSRDQWGELTLRVGTPTRLCEPASKELLQ